MTKVNDYFERKKDELSYLDIKEPIIVKGQEILCAEIPLPIKTKLLVKGIQGGEFQEEIPLTAFIEGIILNLAFHKSFPYQKDYIHFLYGWNDAIEDYIFAQGVEHLDREDALYYFRCLYRLNPKHTLNAAFYGKALFEKALDLGEDINSPWISYANHVLEGVLNLDENQTMALVTLGDICAYQDNFFKADLYYKKALNADEKLLEEEIRKKRLEIMIPLSLQRGRELIDLGNYEEALDILLEAYHKESHPELSYWIGVCYQGMEAYEESVPYFQKVLERVPDNMEAANDLSISYYLLGNHSGAIHVLTEATKYHSEDVRLQYNLMVLLFNEGNIPRAMEIFNKLDEMNQKGLLPYEDIAMAVEDMKEQLL